MGGCHLGERSAPRARAHAAVAGEWTGPARRPGRDVVLARWAGLHRHRDGRRRLAGRGLDDDRQKEPFDDAEAEERDWIAVQLPIPADAALDAQVLHRAMRILRELAAMDMPDGLTVEGPRAPEGSGELVRARGAPPWEAQESDGESAPGPIIVCEAPVAAWQGLLGLPGQRGATPLWGAESKERAIVAHMTHRVRQRLRETGYTGSACR